mmetsp:Transcript_4950/g.14441  ORF Transcript_4950/g.14441 Transcript_4950/m.14441 type:complete len:284 (-) Transcript_4950:1136-1987(-)
MIPADQVNLGWVSHLQCEEKAHSFQGEAATVHEVAKEEVVHRVDVATVSIRRCLVPRKKAHQVQVLPVDVAVNLDRSTQLQHHVLALQDLQDLIAELGHLHGVEQKPVWVGVRLPSGRLQEVLYDEGGHTGCRPRRGDVRHDVGGLDLPALILQCLYVDLLDLVREILLQAHYHLRRHSDIALRRPQHLRRPRGLARDLRPRARRGGRPEALGGLGLSTGATWRVQTSIRRRVGWREVDGAAWYAGTRRVRWRGLQRRRGILLCPGRWRGHGCSDGPLQVQDL